MSPTPCMTSRGTSRPWWSMMSKVTGMTTSGRPSSATRKTPCDSRVGLAGRYGGLFTRFHPSRPAVDPGRLATGSVVHAKAMRIGCVAGRSLFPRSWERRNAWEALVLFLAAPARGGVVGQAGADDCRIALGEQGTPKDTVRGNVE